VDLTVEQEDHKRKQWDKRKRKIRCV